MSLLPAPAPQPDDAPSSALLVGLTPSQRAAVTSPAETLCVLAAAGAGKTRVLTRRIAYRVEQGRAPAEHVLALTFTRKAAAELGQRMAQLGQRQAVVAGTFHSVASAQLRRWWTDRGTPAPALLERKARLLSELVSGRPGLSQAPLAELAGHIEWARARLVDPDHLEEALARSGRSVPCEPAQLAALYQRYEDEKRRRRVMDFDDILGRCADALEQDPRFAAAQRWRWRHVFVDEFQDVNPLQYRLLRAWLGDNRDLCVVGDPNQAIYGWNGADPRLLDRFPEAFPGAATVRLDDNHRSTPQIVATAASVLGPSAARLRSSRADGAIPSVQRYPTEQAEAGAVAGGLRRTHASGLGWSQMAVLVRTNAQIPVIADALRAAHIPYRLPGNGALLHHPVCQALLEDLRRRATLPLAMIVADWRGDPGGTPPTDPSDELGRQGALRAGGQAGEDDPAAVRASIIELAADFGRIEPHASPAGFAAWLVATLGKDAEVVGAEAVTVCSFHRAKGLQWRAVWVCGLERGLVPIGHAESGAAWAEERRLLYVALTRAEDVLHCTWSATRRYGGRTVPREPSPWLAAIEQTSQASGGRVVDLAEAVSRIGEAESRLAEARPLPLRRPLRRLAGADADPALVEHLEAWRQGMARASGVPAHVLLHDASLRVIAERQPATSDELLAIPGLGPVKVSRFGPAILAVLAEHRISA
jgi:DNA helicase-2/ATP-dependent DNA helicase PcrA